MTQNTELKTYTLKEHFLEIKARMQKVVIAFIIAFIVSYYFSEHIYNFILEPLAKAGNFDGRKIIYTHLTEAFFTYIKLGVLSAFAAILPFLAIQIYQFIKPGLIGFERRMAFALLSMSPILFYLGAIFVFYFVMPKAWSFFLSFESSSSIIPITLEAKISEYLSLVVQLMVGFGLAFQMPIILLILNLFGIITANNLKNKRRFAIVINFIIAAILTPPDVISQFALALPLLLLYEISIIMCKFMENREDARH